MAYTWSKYIQHGQIGKGGQGSVYICTKKGDSAREGYAGKILPIGKEQEEQQALAELGILANLARHEHPNIVRFIDSDMASPSSVSKVLIVTEYFRGGDLMQSLTRLKDQHQRALNDSEARLVFQQLLDGVAFLHKNHVIHRDLKPHNVLVAKSASDDGCPQTVKIADFGLSKFRSYGQGGHYFGGTIPWMAPEILREILPSWMATEMLPAEERPFEENAKFVKKNAVDVWSLGIILYNMLTKLHCPGDTPVEQQGKPVPCSAKSTQAKLDKDIEDVSSQLGPLMKGALRKDPSERCVIHKLLQLISKTTTTSANRPHRSQSSSTGSRGTTHDLSSLASCIAVSSVGYSNCGTSRRRPRSVSCGFHRSLRRRRDEEALSAAVAWQLQQQECQQLQERNANEAHARSLQDDEEFARRLLKKDLRHFQQQELHRRTTRVRIRQSCTQQ